MRISASLMADRLSSVEADDRRENANVAARIVAFVANKHNAPSDLRDAAHEAHHALSVDLRGSWERERLNRAMEKRGNVYLLRSEIEARAVEQIVCARLGVDPGGDVTHWSLISCMEAIKNSRLDIGSPDGIARAVRLAMATPAMERAADRVIALARRA